MRLPGRRGRRGPAAARPLGTIRRRGSAKLTNQSSRGERPVAAEPIARTRRPRRIPRLTPGRAGAILGALASAGAIYGLASSPVFDYAGAQIPELRWTTRASVEAAIGVPQGSNLFRLSVAPIEARIRGLPGVAAAGVSVSLPDTLVVDVREREPILAWSSGGAVFVVDRDGVLFATIQPTAAEADGLVVIDDSREVSARLVVGQRLAAVDLDAARRLGSLVPSDVGSVADRLIVSVSDANGFVVGTSPPSWLAIFGGYTPSVRTTDLIPGQVRLLRSRLYGQEAQIDQVILADGTNGTYTLKSTSSATPVPSP